MSFFYTADQILKRTKTVTRRLGWGFAKPGMLVRAVRKCQGLKKGEKIEPLAILRIKSVRTELLKNITQEDVEKEGFPWLSVMDFIDMFCGHMNCGLNTKINRIEFEYAGICRKEIVTRT